MVKPVNFHAVEHLFETITHYWGLECAKPGLEPVIAVPMHLVVRRRTQCCAGYSTGLAICIGVATAFIALGPGVFFLFYRRWAQAYRRGR